jgi:SNF2 family DNA or RNA helicase
MSIFDAIRAAAASGARQGAAAFSSPIDFDGTRLAPSEGYVLPVTPRTKTLYPYQQAAVEEIMTPGLRGSVLALLPGMGKTAVLQCVATARVQQGDRVVVVVPPTLIYSPWVEEWERDYPDVNVCVVTGRTSKGLPLDADVCIVSDAVLSARLDNLKAWAPTVVMGDEAHRYKHHTSARAKAMRTLCDYVPETGIVVMATGTVADNWVSDVWHVVRIAGKRMATALSGATSRDAFLTEWCETESLRLPTGQIVKKVIGCPRAPEMRQRLTSIGMVSVDPDLVLDLPERQWAVRHLVLAGADVERYRRAERDLVAFIRERSGDVAALRASRAEQLVMLQTLWQLDGLAKVEATVAYAEALIEQGEPLVIFGQHREVLGRLFDALGREHRVASITGSSTPEAKASVVERFQQGGLDVIVANTIAGGTGLTLTRSAHAIHVQLPFSPGQYQQSCARIHRISQTRPVTYHTLLMQGGVSERMWEVLGTKAQITDAVNAGTPLTIDEQSMTSAILDSYL